MPKYNVFRVENSAPNYSEHIGLYDAPTAGVAEQHAEAEYGKDTCHMAAELILPQYQIATPLADGAWDVLERFEAYCDEDANEYAEIHWDDQHWYVLDATGRNINGGRDQ